MALLRPFRESLGAIARNPVILAMTGLLALVQVPQFAAQTLGPLVSAVVSIGFSLLYIVAIPYIQGGLFGMADEALDGRTSLGRFHSAGKDHYVSLLVAYLLVFALSLVIGGGLFLVGFVGLFAVVGANLSTAATVAIGLVVALLLLVYVVAFAFVQFYGQAIVLEDLGGIDGLRRSVGTVRSNLLSVFLYTVVVMVFSGGFGLVAGGASLVFSPQPTPGLPIPKASLPIMAAGALLLIVLTALFSAIFLVFSVAFYRDLRGGTVAANAGRDGDAGIPSL
ncbi:hypothetical protein [Halorarum halobium]|uniref:DUF7847 domain-containing protein n=1 Tax=Halorarum halobium TaxID=3075121 RepID=UPI0028B11A90|nr:hypothetical protein [Halobaculum sp. XH14]